MVAALQDISTPRYLHNGTTNVAVKCLVTLEEFEEIAAALHACSHF